jgi:hypothetical protein
MRLNKQPHHEKWVRKYQYKYNYGPSIELTIVQYIHEHPDNHAYPV